MRDGADFCSVCGATVLDPNNTNPAANGTETITTVPLITLAPMENSFSKQRMIRYARAVVVSVLVIVLALAGAAVAAWVSTNPFKPSSFEEVEDKSYRECLALVNDVRNSNFDDIVADVINMEGDAENYNFLQEYEALFKSIVPEDSDPTAVKFRNCCFMVSYTEFTAKKYKYYSERGLLGVFYVDDADKYRSYADELWAMLSDAQTDDELQAIIDYCAEKDIIYLAEAPASSATEQTAPAA